MFHLFHSLWKCEKSTYGLILPCSSSGSSLPAAEVLVAKAEGGPSQAEELSSVVAVAVVAVALAADGGGRTI